MEGSRRHRYSRFMEQFEKCCDFFLGLQDRITAAFEGLEGSTFEEDRWDNGEPRPVSDDPEGPWLGGWGRTRVLEGGSVLERAGVNFSKVRGRFSVAHAATMPGEGRQFQAAGVSVVIHPRSPHLPTCHMNVRRLSRGETGWSGGGGDLTPYYLDEDDARHFHGTYKAACDAHPTIADHAAFKAECDRYFFNTHRGEGRGVGGVFFDHLVGRLAAQAVRGHWLRCEGREQHPPWFGHGRAAHRAPGRWQRRRLDGGRADL